MVTGMEVIFFSCVSAEKWEKAISSRLTKRGGEKQVVILPEAQLTASTKKSTVCAECCVTQESQSF